MKDKFSKLKVRRAGVSVPLLSILTKNSFESGDIHSLKLFGDWAKQCGLSIIQILPLNDLGYGKSPYSSISAFAVDPIYISLYMLGINRTSRSDRIKTLKINHNRIKELKLKILKYHFLKKYNPKLKKELDKFLNEHNFLNSFGVFKILYEKNLGKHWSEWGKDSKYSEALCKKVIKTNEEDFYFQIWMQKVAFEQLKEIKKYLESIGVYLKGDMPILTSGNSADVWEKTHLFDLSLNSGAPPDAFSADGQNWGFPVINWNAMKKENFSWWKDRIQYIENFYHLYRIDHVLGMYRIWAVPIKVKKARMGYFHPQTGASVEEFKEVHLDPKEFVKKKIIYEFSKGKFAFHWDFYLSKEYNSFEEDTKRKLYELSVKHLEKDESNWRKNGEEILDFLMHNSNMLPCAEDLGVVPEFVRDSIHEKKIIGLDIIRWTRSFSDGSYIRPQDYRENAVSSLSVHDTSIGIAWWNELKEDEKRKAMEFTGIKEDYTIHQIIERLLEISLSTKSIFSINLLHDFLFEGKICRLENTKKHLFQKPNKHRINIPGTPEEENWSYRFSFFLEDLLHEDILNSKIKKIVKKSKRLN
ncbi:MAG: 4-alpha-glucanotransferase [Leptospiraceae bacterium]|nr:4-alpha-glucanotransferase [Leptospiraceae bacterium]MCK6380011.1 4-alpha-glucanotransferase [Leptospiraceae bacterium]NUM40315.1 4-alpha-glucanotransferase [Leptospiraceae bacterium]